ncbi:hypothetical protein ABEQ28_12470 [Cutibacterium acnes]
MALSTSTAAQRAELTAASNMLALICHKFDEDGYLATGNTALLAKYAAALNRVQAALAAIGGTGTTTTIVSTGQQLTGVTPYWHLRHQGYLHCC